MIKRATDWTKYYQGAPRYTSVTRSISARKIAGLLKKFTRNDELKICELGGANSCFVEFLYKQLPVAEYHVVDLNEFGLSLLKAKPCPSLTWERGDVLGRYLASVQHDVVFSVGLIEHFSPSGTSKAIASHFARCKPGGVVLITFPTPTLPYRVIRKAAELLGFWSFPDERPLNFQEVELECHKHGSIEHSSINWWIGLTQGYVLTRKRDA